MKERILLLFNSILDENPVKDAGYYRSQGFEVEKDEVLPLEPRYISKDIPYENHSAAINSLFLDISGLIKEAKIIDAFNAYALMIRESAKILKKIDLDDDEYDSFGTYSLEVELIELFQNLSKECRFGIIKLLKAEDNIEFAGRLMKWLQKEVLRKEYRHHRYFITLIELFIDLSNSSSNFKALSDNFVLASLSSGEEPIEFLKLNYHCNYGNLDAAKKIIAANQMKYELDRFFIGQLHRTGMKYEAIEIANESHKRAEAATSGVYKLSLEERAARYNREDLLSAYDFISWSGKFVLDTLLELEDFDKAIDYVYYVFTGEESSKNALNNIGLEYYKILRRSLPKERKGELAERLFGALDQLSVYTVRDLCIYEDFWFPLIEAFKIKSNLSELLDIYKQHKRNLLFFHEDLSEMFYSVISEYVKKDSSSSRKEIIRSGLKELSLIRESESVLFGLLLHLKTEFTRRKVLQNLLEEFILENNIIEDYKNYEIENAKRFPKKSTMPLLDISTPGIRKSKKLNWENEEWSESKLHELSSLKSIFEIKKYLPEDSDELSEHQRQRLFTIYHLSILQYAYKSKKDEETKTKNIKIALDCLKKQFDQFGSVDSLVSELRNKYPKRLKFMVMLSDF